MGKRVKTQKTASTKSLNAVIHNSTRNASSDGLSPMPLVPFVGKRSNLIIPNRIEANFVFFLHNLHFLVLFKKGIKAILIFERILKNNVIEIRFNNFFHQK